MAHDPDIFTHVKSESPRLIEIRENQKSGRWFCLFGCLLPATVGGVCLAVFGLAHGRGVDLAWGFALIVAVFLFGALALRQKDRLGVDITEYGVTVRHANGYRTFEKRIPKERIAGLTITPLSRDILYLSYLGVHPEPPGRLAMDHAAAVERLATACGGLLAKSVVVSVLASGNAGKVIHDIAELYKHKHPLFSPIVDALVAKLPQSQIDPSAPTDRNPTVSVNFDRQRRAIICLHENGAASTLPYSSLTRIAPVCDDNGTPYQTTDSDSDGNQMVTRYRYRYHVELTIESLGVLKMLQITSTENRPIEDSRARLDAEWIVEYLRGVAS